MNTEKESRKVIKAIPPVNPKKFKKLQNYAQRKEEPKFLDRIFYSFLLFISTCVVFIRSLVFVWKKEKPKVSDRIYTVFLLFLAICIVCLIFKFGDLFTFVMQSAKNLYIFIVISLIFIFLYALQFVLLGYAVGYESIEKEISRLKRAHRKAEQGDVYQVQEEIELNGKRFIVPVKSNSGIVTEFQLAIEKAEEVLKKKKKTYDFLAKICFCKEKTIIYKEIKS